MLKYLQTFVEAKHNKISWKIMIYNNKMCNQFAKGIVNFL